MEAIEITIFIMFVIGIAFIIMSFIVKERIQTVNTIIPSVSAKTQDSMDAFDAVSKEVNGKIMELNDYTDFVHKEMENKHKELLFLYQLISEKEKDITSDDVKQLKTHVKETLKPKRQKISLNEGNNHNKAIISLYQQGYNVTEIAKKLSIGKGEVKLVIDLFR